MILVFSGPAKGLSTAGLQAAQFLGLRLLLRLPATYVITHLWLVSWRLGFGVSRFTHALHAVRSLAHSQSIPGLSVAFKAHTLSHYAEDSVG
jgi:hypothetical protein